MRANKYPMTAGIRGVHNFRIALCCVTCIAATGCGSFSDIPGSASVRLPGGKSIVVPAGSGPSNLANTKWACFRSDTGSFIVNVEFGARGEVKRFYENAVYFPEILGSELVPDGNVRSNTFPGMTYSSGSFGASAGNEFGFVSPLNIWIAGIKVGTGSAYAYGIVNGDRIEGTFGYNTEILGGGSPFQGGGRDEYEFFATKLR